VEQGGELHLLVSSPRQSDWRNLVAYGDLQLGCLMCVLGVWRMEGLALLRGPV